MRKSHILWVIFLTAFTFNSCNRDSKVIESFGYKNENLEESISLSTVKNGVFRGVLERNLDKNSLKYQPMCYRLKEAQKVSDEFYY